MADTTEVIYADRDRCCDDRNRGYGAGWGAVGGALVGGGFGAAAVSVWDKVNDVKANIEKILDDRIKKEIDPVRQMVMDIHNALFTKEPSKNEVEQTAKA